MSQKGDKLVSHGSYIAGWLDSSVQDFVGALPSTFNSMEYALLTCLDSNTDPTSLLETSPGLRSLGAEARPLGRGLLLPTKRLLEVESCDQIFFGFDEVWFFPSAEVGPKPETAWLVGPARIDQQTLDQLGGWMTANSCSLALGDGDGLNFVVKGRGLVRHVLGHSNSQPAPTLRNDLVYEEETTGGNSVREDLRGG